MYIFYFLSIQLYKLALVLASPFNEKAKKMLQGRKEVWKELSSTDLKDCLWIHSSSLGEFEQGRPIIEKYKAKYSNGKVLVTFFSPSGYDIRKDYALADKVCYLPFDSKRNAKRFIELVKPKQAVFVKYEYWYHFLKELNKADIPTFIVSSIFRKKQLFFKSYGKWYLKMLHFFTRIFVQDKDSNELLKSVNVTNADVVGDTRFDRVLQIVENAKELPQFEDFTKEKRSIVAGSTWPKDEEIITDYLSKNKDVKAIIAPHEIHYSHIDQMVKLFGDSCILYSKVGDGDIPKDKQIVIVDCMGMLSSIYRYGDIAYIGGGFGVGIHNTLEAASHGMPVLFGPNYQKFKEARDLIQVGASISINNQEEFSKSITELFSNEEEFKKACISAKEYVLASKGATDAIMAYLK